MAQSVGNGVYQEGRLISNFGTGGQVSAYMSRMTFDREMQTNTFCHAVNKGYSVFGATLNCGSALKWLCKSMYKFDERCYEIAEKLAEESPAGSKGIIYLPYLSGERSPIMNSEAKGVFFGLKLEHDKRHILRAGMEGIIYSLKDCLLTLQQMGIDSKEIIASGGGVANDLMLYLKKKSKFAMSVSKRVLEHVLLQEQVWGCLILIAHVTDILPVATGLICR